MQPDQPVTYEKYHAIRVGDDIKISMDNGGHIVRTVVEHNWYHEPRISYGGQTITIDNTRVIGIIPKKGA